MREANLSRHRQGELTLESLAFRIIANHLQSMEVVSAAQHKSHLKVMCGFSRRFDSSYRDAYEKIEAGLIGRPSIIRSQTCDKHDPSGFFVKYAALNGGCFVDMSGK